MLQMLRYRLELITHTLSQTRQSDYNLRPFLIRRSRVARARLDKVRHRLGARVCAPVGVAHACIRLRRVPSLAALAVKPVSKQVSSKQVLVSSKRVSKWVLTTDCSLLTSARGRARARAGTSWYPRGLRARK